MDMKRINELRIDRTVRGRLSHLIRYAQLTDDEKNELVAIIEQITTGTEKKEVDSQFSISQQSNLM